MKLYYNEQEVQQKDIKLDRPMFEELVYPIEPIDVNALNQVTNKIKMRKVQYNKVRICKGPNETTIYVLDGFENYVLDLHEIERYY